MQRLWSKQAGEHAEQHNTLPQQQQLAMGKNLIGVYLPSIDFCSSQSETNPPLEILFTAIRMAGTKENKRERRYVQKLFGACMRRILFALQRFYAEKGIQFLYPSPRIP